MKHDSDFVFKGKINSWQQGPYVKANGDEDVGGGGGLLSCLLDTWSVAPVNHFAEAISTPVSEPWHLTGSIGPCTETDNGCQCCVNG